VVWFVTEYGKAVITIGLAQVEPASGPAEGVGEQVTLDTHPVAFPEASVLKCAVRQPPETLDVITLPHPALLVGPAKLKRGMPDVSAVKALAGVPLKIRKRSPASFKAIDVKETVTY
jgi:hypothetical protein